MEAKAEAEEEEEEERGRGAPRTAAITAAIYTIRSKGKSSEWAGRRGRGLSRNSRLHRNQLQVEAGKSLVLSFCGE